MRYSIVWEFTSWSDRSRIAYKRRVEKWSNRRWKRRNSISMKKQEFWSRDFAIKNCAEMFQRRNAWSYRRIIEWCSFFILIWRLSILRKCLIFKLIWRLFIIRNAFRSIEDRESFRHFELEISDLLRFESEIFLFDSNE